MFSTIHNKSVSWGHIEVYLIWAKLRCTHTKQSIMLAAIKLEMLAKGMGGARGGSREGQLTGPPAWLLAPIHHQCPDLGRNDHIGSDITVKTGAK